MDFVLILGMNEAICQLAMANNVLVWSCDEEGRWSCLENGIKV